MWEMRLSVLLLHNPGSLMKLEVRITEDTHLRTIKTFDLGFLADANRRDQIADLEPDVGHDESEDRDDRGIDGTAS